MKCQRCGQELAEGDGRELRGEILCDDCYIDAAYPPKACDPWAVYIATRTREASGQGGAEGLTERQKEIYDFVNSRGRVTPEELAQHFALPANELQSELTTLRHCELVRGQKEGNKVYLTTF
ncbi:MAG: hypothetical protein ACOC58_03645 [Chloroflexota bacterium]